MESGKAFLKKSDPNGVSVYSHLTDVLASLLETQPANALAAFEGVSTATKAKAYTAGAVSIPPAPTELPDPNAEAGPGEAWAAATSALLAAVKPDEEAATPAPVPDILAESKLFECAGVGLSADETYCVYASVVALQKSMEGSTARFFGKILGVPTDYYVAEVTGYTPPDPEEGAPEPPAPPADAEAAGTGLNTFTYFVTTDLSKAWTALPDVTPEQIKIAGRIRKYVTGDLAADVRAYPGFPGKEKEYVRALIARLFAATTLAPAGKFSLSEEGEVTEVEVGTDEGQRTAPSASVLGELDGWCTRYMGILEIGRTTNLPVEEEEEDSDKPKPPPPQPEIPALSPLSAEEWTATTYSHGGPPVAVASSLKWPGALTAYQLGKGAAETCASIYIGYGLPRLTTLFQMEAPPPFQEEPAEVHEQADMPLDEENAIFVAAETARIAEEAAALPDPEE